MISVCIATYNGQSYIIEQLVSILDQLGADDEVVISDDSSTDDTIKIIESLGDKRVRIFPNNKFYNPIFNVENALKHSCGKIIILADQDDIWLPTKVDYVLSSMEKADLVLSNAYVVDVNLNKSELFFSKNKNPLGLFKNIFINHYIGATMAFRKELLLKALPFPRKIPMHDQWIGLIGEIYFQTKYIQEPLILYRRHGGNASYSGERSKNTFIRKVFFRLSIFWAIVKRVVQIALSNGKK